MVARKNDNIFRVKLIHKFNILKNCVRRALIPFALFGALIRRQNEHAARISVKIPRVSVTNIGIQFKRLILRQHTDGIDARVQAVAERKIYNPVFSSERNGRLCNMLCQNAESAALPSCQNHCNTFSCFHHLSPPCFFFAGDVRLR